MSEKINGNTPNLYHIGTEVLVTISVIAWFQIQHNNLQKRVTELEDRLKKVEENEESVKKLVELLSTHVPQSTTFRVPMPMPTFNYQHKPKENQKRDVREVEDMRKIEEVEDIRKIEDIRKVEDIRKIEEVEDIRKVEEVEDIRKVEEVKNEVESLLENELKELEE